MNLLQLVQRTFKESRRQGTMPTTLDSPSSGTQDLINWVADAWRDLQNDEQGWAWMRRELTGSTIQNQLVYSAVELDGTATEFGRWFKPAIPNYRVTIDQAGGGVVGLTYIDWDAFRQRYVLTPHTAGRPQVWSVDPGTKKLALGPKPDAVYTVRASYYRKPQELTQATDTPEMDAEWHMILVWRALMELASVDAAPEVYTRALVRYETLESGLRKRFGQAIEFGNNTLSGGSGGGNPLGWSL